MAERRVKKLGILLTRHPDSDDARWALSIAESAVGRGIDTEIFLMDDGVELLRPEWTDRLEVDGLRFTVCTQTIKARGLPADHPDVDYAGQVQLGRLVRRSDRFLAFA